MPPAGNLRDQKISASTTSVFTHDAWNRLVKHIYTVTGGASLSSIHYQYNGLHWRTVNKNLTGEISEESGNSGTLKEMYYSAAWQLLEERIDEDCITTPGTDRTAQEVWGLRYIDDAVMRTADVGSEKDPRRFYHLTDVQFSTVAMLPVGALRSPVYERVGYEPYGKASHRWAGDVNNDGAVNSTDVGLVTTAAAANSGAGYTMGVHSAYDVRMDINRDGLVDGDDEDLFTALPAEAALGTGEISDRSANGPDNVFGYDGYVFAPELSRYCVRFRWHDPGTGRWMERDPLGTAGGMMLYSYVDASPIGNEDPLGLVKCSKCTAAQQAFINARMSEAVARMASLAREVRQWVFPPTRTAMHEPTWDSLLAICPEAKHWKFLYQNAFRDAARKLQKLIDNTNRHINKESLLVRCCPPTPPAGSDCAVNCGAGADAFSIPGWHPNSIFVCPSFFTRPNWRAMQLLIHEASHLAGSTHGETAGPFEAAVLNAHTFEQLSKADVGPWLKVKVCDVISNEIYKQETIRKRKEAEKKGKDSKGQ